jgi:glucose/arabinose dehydrogenase
LKQTPMWAGRAVLLFATLIAPSAGFGNDAVRSGATAYGDWRDDAPGVRRLITPADLPSPYATPSTSNSAQPSVRPASTFPKAPAGFAVDLFADGLSPPRVIRVAPNGDTFVAESGAGHVRVFRVDETNAKSVSSQPARAGPTNELLWLRSFHVASAFPSGGFASPEGGAFTTPVV